MNENDIKFKKTALNIGVSLLIFFAVYQTAYADINWLFRTSLYFKFPNETIANIVTEVTMGAAYLAIFLIPALICERLNKKVEKKPQVCPTPCRSPKIFVLTIFAAIGIITAMAYVNSILATTFGVSGSLIQNDSKMTLVDFLLSTLTVSLIPGFCEEFLFRRTILKSLLPYGEGFAIITSALLFGLMHQNLLQIFYATMAGIVLGCAYSRTRSFLCVFLIHSANNFTSVIQEVFANNFSEKMSNLLGVTFTLVILLASAASILILMIKETDRKRIYREGSFGRIDIPSPSYTKKELSMNPTATVFLSPTVLIFTIASVCFCIYRIFI